MEKCTECDKPMNFEEVVFSSDAMSENEVEISFDCPHCSHLHSTFINAKEFLFED